MIFENKHLGVSIKPSLFTAFNYDNLLLLKAELVQAEHKVNNMMIEENKRKMKHNRRRK